MLDTGFHHAARRLTKPRRVTGGGQLVERSDFEPAVGPTDDGAGVLFRRRQSNPVDAHAEVTVGALEAAVESREQRGAMLRGNDGSSLIRPGFVRLVFGLR